MSSSASIAAAEAAASKGLPHPWRAVWDVESRDFYYWNEDSDETTWIKPTAHNASLPTGWTAVYDEDSGDYFYWNMLTDKTQWEKPEFAAAAGAELFDSSTPRDEEPDEATPQASGKRKAREVIMAESYDPAAGGKVEIKRVDKPESSKATIRSALQGSAGFLFSSLSPPEIETVVMAMTERVLNPGDVVIKQGDQGDNWYVVESGTFDIYVSGNKVASRGPGDSFGELALLYNCPRAATVKAATPARLWALDRVTFRYMIASTREGQLSDISRGLRNVELLKPLTDDQLNRVAEAVKVVTYKKGERVINKGEFGDTFFMIKSGRVVCSDASAAGKRMEDMYIAAGGHFGERALMLAAPRAANVTALEDLTVYALGRKDFNELLGPLHTLLENDLLIRVINAIPVLASLTSEEHDKVMSAFKPRDLADKTLLVRAGQTLSALYVVKSGGLKMTKGGRADTMGQGGYLGDRALFKDEPADGDYVAAGSCTVLTLDRRDFEVVVGSAAAFLGRPTPSVGAGVSVSKLTAGAVAKRTAIRKEDLEVLRTLGAGTFGRVKLVRHRPTNRPFALKVLQKTQVVAHAQQRNVINERNVMMMVDHPFVLKLEATFKDANCLYMLLELVQGGELFTFLANTKLGYVSVDDARFFAACVLSGLEALHEQNILYRDLKPENMLLDAQGYIKIVDMGFTKVVRDRTYTLCGTPEYLAPELVLGQGHYRGVDYWALGILIYEMVSGHSPFYDPLNNDQMVICKNIVKGKFSFPSHVKDKEVRDIVTKLLTRTVTNRLGCRKEGAQEIKQHKFFATMDWNALLMRKLKAPWVPPLKDPFDTSCFDKCDAPETIQHYVDDGSGWDADF